MAQTYEGRCDVTYTTKDDKRYSMGEAHREVTIHDDGSITTFNPSSGKQEHYPKTCAPTVTWPFGRTAK